MYQLTVKSPDGASSTYSLDKGELRIGRDPDNDVVLQSSGVSRRHARIYIFNDSVFIEDLASTAGVFIGGVEVRQAVIVQPGIPIGVDRYTLIVERHDADGADAIWGYLTCESSPFTGKVVPLDETEIFIGRAGEENVVIDHPSISRRHARVAREGAGARITDLDSSNGVFVDGRKVREAALKDGALVTLGDIRMIFKMMGSSPGPVPSPAGASKRSVAVLSAILLVLAVLVVGLAIRQQRDHERQLNQAAERQRPAVTREDAVGEFIAGARARVEKEHWDEALAEVGKAIDRDPINSDAQKLKNRIVREMGARKIFEEAEMSAALGKLDDARRQYLSIPRDSLYSARAVPKIKDIDRRIATAALKEARALSRKGDLKKVHDRLVEALDADPENADALKMIKDTEAAMEKRRLKFDAWEPPAVSGSNGGTGDPDTLLRQKYPDEKLRKCMVLYFRGKPDEALRELNRLLSDPKASDLVPAVESIQREIFLARGKFTEGQGHLLQNNVREAARFWKTVLDVDSRLVPANPPSYYRDEVSRQLAEAYLKAGSKMYEKERYEEAFEQWRAAYDIAPDNIEVLHALKKLERTAERMYEDTITTPMNPQEKTSRYQLIKSITLPAASVNKMASMKLAGGK
jgi:pSer/pThr/pTyr-binding forkhead associated (FHA) protein